MKRIFAAVFVAAIAACAFFVPTMRQARADVTTGYPYSYTLVADLNAVGLSQTLYNVQNAGQCLVTVRGVFVGGLDIYTSILGTFADAVKQGSEITGPGTYYVQISALASPPSAIRVQNRAYTSGDPLSSIDCQGGILATGSSAQPTPSATP